jgi:ATP-dependent protease HslVU (ClpYQ) ATPase subunit
MENLLEDISFNAGGDYPLTKVEVDEAYVKEHISKQYQSEDLQKFIL